jgi:phage shock protein PspC (stress-responsive transcriptional regulator)
MNRRLYRSTTDRVIAGVCGGLADLWGIDPSLLRIGWFVLIILTGGIFFLIYIVMAIVVPAGPPSPYDRWGSAAPGAPQAWGAGWNAGWGATPDGTTPGAASQPGAWPGWGTTADGAGGTAAGAAAGAAFANDTAATEEGATEPWASPPLAAPVAPPPPAWGTPPPPTWTGPPPSAAWSHEHRGPGAGAIVFGLILVIIGAAFLINQFVPSIDMGILWPAAAIVLGAVLLVAAFIPGRRD